MPDLRGALTLRREPVTSPGVGAEWTRTNDSGRLWLIRAVTWRLTTSVVAGNRRTSLRAMAGTDAWFTTISAADTPASQTRLISAWNGSPASADSLGAILVAWPQDGLWLPPGHVLSSVTVAIDAGDQHSEIFLTILEYPAELALPLYPVDLGYIRSSEE